MNNKIPYLGNMTYNMYISVICHLTVGENFQGFSGFNSPGWSLISASDFTGFPSSRYADGMRLVEVTFEARLRCIFWGGGRGGGPARQKRFMVLVVPSGDRENWG